MSHIAYFIAILLLVPGIFMAFVPMLPALSYMFVIAMVFGIYDSFVYLKIYELLILLSITILSIVSDHISGLIGAKYGGAHAKSLLFGLAGAIICTFFLPIPVFGSFIGVFIGVLVGEFYYNKPHDKALKAASGALLGSVAGVIINIILALSFFIIFAFLAYK